MSQPVIAIMKPAILKKYFNIGLWSFVFNISWIIYQIDTCFILRDQYIPITFYEKNNFASAAYCSNLLIDAHIAFPLLETAAKF